MIVSHETSRLVRISLTRLELHRAKPRSRRRVELELRLRDLVLRQLRSEARR
jgi:hypothetical protein